MGIRKLERYEYKCEECGYQWILVNANLHRAYFCPNCGKQQPVLGMFGEYKEVDSMHYKRLGDDM